MPVPHALRAPLALCSPLILHRPLNPTPYSLLLTLCCCIDYANGAKLDCATPWKNVSTVYLPIFINDHWILDVVDILGGKISIYDSMIDLTKDSVLVRQLLPVADMIHLVLQKIAYHETHPDCSEVILKIPWPIVRVCDSPQQKSGGDCGAFLLRYLEILIHGLDINSYCQQDYVTQFRKTLAVKLFGHRSWKKTL
ncbi:hypothetical protein CUMW_015970 [Citrus unshiu]|nr:hypothetical protein CUMW_015970 [Citrus unshiu]